MKEISMQLTRRSSAPPEAIYDSLADLSTHTTWGGAKQLYNFRHRRHLVHEHRDRTNVPAAIRGRFEGHGWPAPKYLRVRHQLNDAKGKRPMAATYRHRYQIVATPEGSKVTYTTTQLSGSNLLLRLSLPGIRNMTWRLGSRSWPGVDSGTWWLRPSGREGW